MSKISKNIRQLRKERGMTQDELAEKLFVTRQAVSSWENDRTQPDVHMLGRLREIFGVSIEELLYGEKRNTALELEKPDYTSSLVTAFSVLGAILTGAGLVMVFVFSWERLPKLIKGALCFLPLLLGQTAGAFVLAKKKEKKPWREGASVLWMVGIISSTLLCYSFFNFRISEYVTYAVMAVMILPVMFLLKSVAALPVFYFTGAWACFSLGDYNLFVVTVKEILFQTAAGALLLSVLLSGVYFTRKLRKNEPKSVSSRVAEWITAVAIPVATTVYVALVNPNYNIWICWLSAVVLSYYIIGQRLKESVASFGVLGFIGTVLLSGYYGIAFDFSDACDFSFRGLVTAVAGIALVVGAAVFVKGRFERKTQLASAAVFLIMQIVYAFDPKFTLTFFSLAFFSLMIAEGAMIKKLIPMNTGFIGFLYLVVCWIIESDLDTLTIGLILIACGGALLGANVAIVKSKKKLTDKAQEVSQ